MTRWSHGRRIVVGIGHRRKALELERDKGISTRKTVGHAVTLNSQDVVQTSYDIRVGCKNYSFKSRGTCAIYTVAVSATHMREILRATWQKTKGTISYRTRTLPRDSTRSTSPKKSLEGWSRDILTRIRNIALLFLCI